MILKALAAAVMLVLFGGQTLAQVLPAPESDTASDFSRILPPEDEARIAGLLTALRDETGVQMVVVTMPSITLYGGSGMRLDSYAKALFNTWGIGGADRNDGILMLIATDDREVRIALGAGYDAVYDGRAARVLTTAVLPEFRQDRIVAGIEAGILSSRERLVAPFLEGLPVDLDDGFVPETGTGPLGPILGFLGVGGVVSFLIWRGARERRRCPKCGELTLERTKEVIDPPTFSATGTAMEHMTCTNCGHIDRRFLTLPRSRSDRTTSRSGSGGSSGGSRGGFGGGRSSGGGASGKW